MKLILTTLFIVSFSNEIWAQNRRQPEERRIWCSSRVYVNGAERDQVTVYASCSENISANVDVYNYETGEYLCGRFLYLSTVRTRVCETSRTPFQKQAYRVRIQGHSHYGQSVYDSQTFWIFKDPTHNQDPGGDYNTPREISALKKSRIFGTGYVWTADVAAKVFDGDLDPEEGLRELKVQLIYKENVIDEKNVRTLSTATFTLKHEWIKPLLGGEPYYKGVLSLGANELRVRVWDAYSGGNYRDLDPIIVKIE